jgi:hypothetical protein
MMNRILGLFLMIACALIGAFVAVIGAKVAGLPDNSWSLEPLVYLVVGFGVGALGYLILVGVLSNKKGGSMIQRAAMSATGAVILSFLSGLVGYPIARHNGELNNQKSQILAAASDRRYQDFYSILRSDPGIVVRDRWDKATDERRHAYRMSLQTLDVTYSQVTLSQLYSLDDQMTVMLLAHPSFDADLLEREFHRTLKKALRGVQCDSLQAIMRNPTAKDEWFAEVAASGILEKDIFLCSDSLKILLERRQRSQDGKSLRD